MSFPQLQLLELQAEYHKNSHEFLSKNISELKENHSQKGEIPSRRPVHVFAAALRLAYTSPVCLLDSAGPPICPSSQKVYGEPLMSHLTQSNRDIAAPVQECIHMLLRTGMREEVGLTQLISYHSDCGSVHLDQIPLCEEIHPASCE